MCSVNMISIFIL